MEKGFIPIYYDGFWDVPHAFLTIHNNELYFFLRGEFDENLDDYPPNYCVYLVKNTLLEEAFEIRDPPHQSVKIKNIPVLEQNELIGKIAIKDVIFDQTHRRFVSTMVFNLIKPTSDQ